MRAAVGGDGEGCRRQGCAGGRAVDIHPLQAGDSRAQQSHGGGRWRRLLLHWNGEAFEACACLAPGAAQLLGRPRLHREAEPRHRGPVSALDGRFQRLPERGRLRFRLAGGLRADHQGVRQRGRGGRQAVCSSPPDRPREDRDCWQPRGRPHLHAPRRAWQLDAARSPAPLYPVVERLQPEEGEPSRRPRAVLRVLQLLPDAQGNPHDPRHGRRDRPQALEHGGPTHGSKTPLPRHGITPRRASPGTRGPGPSRLQTRW